MRIGRAKAARRTLQFFQRTTGLRPPYHVLLDGNIVVAAIRYKIPLFDRLRRLLQKNDLILCMTRATLQEMAELQKHAKEDKLKTLQEAYRWAVQHCQRIIEDDQVPTSCGVKPRKLARVSAAGQVILRCLTNEAEDSVCYLLASQDDELLDVVRHVGTVPVIRLAQCSVLLLEQPSKAAEKQASSKERTKWTSPANDKEKALVEAVREQVRKRRREDQLATKDVPPPNQRRTVKKAKGPNPLSCKKKQSESSSEPAAKRRRRKKSSSGGSEDAA